MTFKEGVMPYLCFIGLCNENNSPWIKSLGDGIVYGESKISERHKERLILWAYKKKLINTKDLTRGIWLTNKGIDYIESHASEKDLENGRKLFEFTIMTNRKEFGE